MCAVFGVDYNLLNRLGVGRRVVDHIHGTVGLPHDGAPHRTDVVLHHVFFFERSRHEQVDFSLLTRFENFLDGVAASPNDFMIAYTRRVDHPRDGFFFTIAAMSHMNDRQLGGEEMRETASLGEQRLRCWRKRDGKANFLKADIHSLKIRRPFWLSIVFEEYLCD